MLPLDLHVLGLSLAFILSQDQTLRCIKKFNILSLECIKLYRKFIDKVIFLYLPNFLFSIFSKNLVDNSQKSNLVQNFSFRKRQSLLSLKAVAKIRILILIMQINF